MGKKDSGLAGMRMEIGIGMDKNIREEKGGRFVQRTKPPQNASRVTWQKRGKNGKKKCMDDL